MAPVQSKSLTCVNDPPENGDVAPNMSRRRNILVRVYRDFTETPEHRRLSIALLALVVSSSTNLAFPTILGKVVDLAIKSDSAAELRAFIATVAGIFGTGAIASWIRVYSFNLCSHRIEQRMRKLLFHKLLMQDIEFSATQRSGDLHIRLVDDVGTASKALTVNLAQGLRGLNSTIGGTAMLMVLCPKLTLVTLSLVPIIGFGAIAYRRYVKKLTRQMQDSLGQAMSYGEERLSNLETVRLFGMETAESTSFNKCLDRFYPFARGVCSADGLLMAGLSLTVNTALVTVLYFGGTLVRQGKLSMGNLTSFAIYSSMVGLGCSSLSSVYGNVVKASASADRVFSILDRPLVPCSGAVLPKVSGEITFSKVTFEYQNRPGQDVLDDFSLIIRPGETVALTGASGCGKTTVARLLTRLLDPTKGEICLDGHTLSSLNPCWLRDHVFGVVNQEPVLFDMSIAENIAYGRPTATAIEIEKAGRQANADDFIRALPQGYHTPVGERGAQLSVGQKQRIAIARALLKDPPCLILDEATSALDSESAGLVRTALLNLMQGRTVLIIAHDADILKCAQRVEVMSAGKIAANNPV